MVTNLLLPLKEDLILERAQGHREACLRPGSQAVSNQAPEGTPFGYVDGFQASGGEEELLSLMPPELSLKEGGPAGEPTVPVCRVTPGGH